MTIKNKKEVSALKNKKEVSALKNKKEVSALKNKKEVSALKNKKEVSALKNKKEVSALKNKKEVSALKNKKEVSALKNKKEVSALKNKKEVSALKNKKEVSALKNKKEVSALKNKKEVSPLKNKKIFTLKNIIGINIISSIYFNVPEETEFLPQTSVPIDNEMSISDLKHEKSKKAIYFLDAHKNQIKYWINMFDFTLYNGGALPLSTNDPCWWDRHSFTSRPLGCPIKYHDHKKYGRDKEKIEEKFKKAGIDINTNDFLETEGIFCSFPCIMAYILSQSNILRYKESTTLLTFLYYILFGVIIEIPEAPSWKIIKKYGGHLEIEEFRATFGKLIYDETVNVKRPYMYSNSRYISEKVNKN